MKTILMISSIVFFSIFSFAAEANLKTKTPQVLQPVEVKKANYKSKSKLEQPLIERYILDELKSLRMDGQKLRSDVTSEITKAELNANDRAISYTTNTMNNIFYVIALTSSLILIVGVKSIRDIKVSSEKLLEDKINVLTKEFEGRLFKIEEQAKKRFKIISENQEKIEENEAVSALWKRAGLEEDAQSKIDIYDEIIKIRPNGVEAFVYKADALLELNEARWALSLSNQAVNLDSSYAMAYWQRACAKTALDRVDEALIDIKKSLEISPSLVDKLDKEAAFKPLARNKEFKSFLELKKS